MPSTEDELPLFGVNPNQHELEEAMLALTALGYSEKELEKLNHSLKKMTINNDRYLYETSFKVIVKMK